MLLYLSYMKKYRPSISIVSPTNSKILIILYISTEEKDDDDD